MSTADDTVRGLRAAARVTGWSPSGLQKAVDAGRIPAEKDGRTYLFRMTDLLAIRRSADAKACEIATSSTVASPAVDHGVALVSTDVSATCARPSTGSEGAPNGERVASLIFADLQRGRDLRQIVIDHELSPEVVRAVHTEWLALSTVDSLCKPGAEVRLAQIEEVAQRLAHRLTEIENAWQPQTDEAAKGREFVERRLRALELRATAVRSTGPILQRVEALEQLVRVLPLAPLLLDRYCPGCGNALAVAAACTGCGAGRAAS